MEKAVTNFDDYLISLETRWIRVILILGFTLVPLFGLLDAAVIPRDKMFFFWKLRGIATGTCILQYLLLRRLDHGPLVTIHAYLFTFIVGGMISRRAHCK